MGRRTVYNVGFLTVTAVAVGWELIAAFDNSPDTQPWTDLIYNNIPGPITAVAIVTLVVWLPIHFWRRYHQPKDRQK